MQIDLCYIESPLGKIVAGADPSGICLLEFADENNYSIEELNFRFKTYSFEFHYKVSDLLNQLSSELNEYFLGHRKSFTLPLSLYGTDFQKKFGMNY